MAAAMPRLLKYLSDCSHWRLSLSGSTTFATLLVMPARPTQTHSFQSIGCVSVTDVKDTGVQEDATFGNALEWLVESNHDSLDPFRRPDRAVETDVGQLSVVAPRVTAGRRQLTTGEGSYQKRIIVVWPHTEYIVVVMQVWKHRTQVPQGQR